MFPSLMSNSQDLFYSRCKRIYCLLPFYFKKFQVPSLTLQININSQQPKPQTPKIIIAVFLDFIFVIYCILMLEIVISRKSVHLL